MLTESNWRILAVVTQQQQGTILLKGSSQLRFELDSRSIRFDTCIRARFERSTADAEMKACLQI